MLEVAIIIALVIAIFAFCIGVLQPIISRFTDTQTVITGSETLNCYYITAGGTTLNTPPTVNNSNGVPNAWNQNYGIINFTPGYWMVTLYSTIMPNTSSIYYSSASTANLCNFQLGLAINPASTTTPSGEPYNFTQNGPYWINGTDSNTIGSTNSSNINPEGTGAIRQSPGGNSFSNNYVGGGVLGMFPYTLYVNVPQSVTYYVQCTSLFANSSSTITSYNQCPFTNSVSWVATKLGRTKSQTVMPYSTPFTTGSGTSGTSGKSGTSGTSGKSGTSSTTSTTSTTPTASSSVDTFMNMQHHTRQRHNRFTPTNVPTNVPTNAPTNIPTGYSGGRYSGSH